MRNRRYDRLVCEDFLRLDIRELSFGTDAPEWQYPVSPFAVSVALDHARVLHDGLDHLVEIERTRCNYGDTRPWFLCPACGNRRAVLYALPGGSCFGCRRCLRLLYLSECEDTFGRGLLKVRKLERSVCESIGGLVGTAHPVDKPKGQHWTTYERHIDKLEWARNAFLLTWKAAQGRS